MSVEIIGAPTVRETDGLAMSSRNQRLSVEGRIKAAALYRELQAAAVAIQGGAPLTETLERASAAIVSSGFESVEYLELRSAEDLKPLSRYAPPARLLVAAWIDGVRLIDNIAV